MKKIILIALLMAFVHYNSFGQRQQQLVDEYEVSVGYSVFQGDYGVKGDFTSTLGNSGFLIGGKAYFNILNYDNYNCYPCKHVKFPLGYNIGYSLLNFDKVDFKNNSIESLKLKAFRGQIFESSLSFGFEYHIGDLNKFAFNTEYFYQNFDPYFGASIGGTAYVVKLKSDLGDYETNPGILPEAFKGGIYDKPGAVGMLLLEAGLRYKISSSINLTLSSKWLYYFSDKVDGLVPNPDMVPNVHNDWQFSPAIGVVFLLRYGRFFAMN